MLKPIQQTQWQRVADHVLDRRPKPGHPLHLESLTFECAAKRTDGKKPLVRQIENTLFPVVELAEEEHDPQRKIGNIPRAGYQLSPRGHGLFHFAQRGLGSLKMFDDVESHDTFRTPRLSLDDFVREFPVEVDFQEWKRKLGIWFF